MTFEFVVSLISLIVGLLAIFVAVLGVVLMVWMDRRNRKMLKAIQDYIKKIAGNLEHLGKTETTISIHDSLVALGQSLSKATSSYFPYQYWEMESKKDEKHDKLIWKEYLQNICPHCKLEIRNPISDSSGEYCEHCKAKLD